MEERNDKQTTAGEYADEADITRAYRDASDAVPAARVDAAILRAAADELRQDPAAQPRSWWQEWSRPLSTLAVMGVCLALVLSVINNAPQRIDYSAAAPPAGLQFDQPLANTASAERQQATAPELVQRSAERAAAKSAPAEFSSGTMAGIAAPRAAQRALVLGGTGRLGAAIVEQLRAAGYPVTVLAREDSDRARLAELEVDYVTADLLDAAALQNALAKRRFSYVIDASARGSYTPPFYEAVMQNTLAALDPAPVRQFILHGSIGAGDSASVFSAAMYARVAGVMAEKTAAEELLKASGLPYTIIRNGVIKRDGTAATGTAELTEDTQRMGTVTRTDLAALTLDCFDSDACLNKTLHAVDASWADEPGY